MKNNQFSSAIISFITPILMLAGMFVVADFFISGFFAIIYAIIFFAGALMLFLLDSSLDKISFIINPEYICFFLVLLTVSYLISVLFIAINAS